MPNQILRVPEKRKTKIRDQIARILLKPCCEFHDLEKLRGRLCSLIILCPLTRLYIREMTKALTLGISLSPAKIQS